LSLEARVGAAFNALFPDGPPPSLGIAISGGGDSTALLLLARAWAPDCALKAATVDHQLRDGSAAEAARAGKLCEDLGIAHEVLEWGGWAGEGNLQDAARAARRALLADWAEREGLRHVALGHTLDDQAETVLMRLARGSGVDGLAAMRRAVAGQGITWVRPLLDATREELRSWLEARGVDWIDDPSNEDPRFDRVKARKMTAQLSALGLTPERLVRTAGQMALARDALEEMARRAVAQHVKVDRGDVLLAHGLADVPEETRLRITADALGWVASAPYRPRYDSLRAVLHTLERARQATLHGCLLTREKTHIRIAREYAAVTHAAGLPSAPWDGRWKLDGPRPAAGSHIAALGAIGLAECPDAKASGLPRNSLMASPALWNGERLLAAPLAGKPAGYTARLLLLHQHLVSATLSH